MRKIKIIILLSFCLYLNHLHSQEVKIGIIMSPAGFTSLKGLENEHKLNYDVFGFGIEINNFILDYTPSTSTFFYEKSNGYETFGKTIYTGQNGGNYYINSNGNKIYVNRGTTSSTYQMETFNMYELEYFINNFGVGYKFSHKNLIYGPYVGANIITSNVNELKHLSEDILGENVNGYYQNDLSNTTKSRIVFGGIIGIKFKDSFYDNESWIDMYVKITNKNLSLNVIFKLYSDNIK